MAKKFSQFTSNASPADADEVVGLAAGSNVRTTLSTLWTFLRGKLTTSPVTIAEGGTGAATTAAARTALSVPSTAEQTSAIGAALTTERTATVTLTNKDLSDASNTLPASLTALSAVTVTGMGSTPHVNLRNSGNASGGAVVPIVALQLTGAVYSADGFYLSLLGNGNNDVDLLVQRKMSSDGAPVTIMCFEQDGDIGIGTTSPQAKLHVNGTVQIGNIRITTSSGATGNNFVVNTLYNSMGGAESTGTISGGGQGSRPNIIGSTAKPQGTDYTPTGWADDTGYVADSANVATISGGYDHVNNQLAGTIAGGGHNYIKYNVNGHGFIGGGSYNVMGGGRGFIGAGRQNSALTGDFINILGGDDNDATGTHANILGGEGNSITGAVYSTILGGRGNASTGNYAVVGGRRAISSAAGAWAFSDSTDADFTNSTSNSMAMRFSGGYNLSGGPLVAGGSISPSASTVTWTAGTGSPEGAVTAPVGSMYSRTDGGTGTALYVKESGVGNTGWAAK